MPVSPTDLCVWSFVCIVLLLLLLLLLLFCLQLPLLLFLSYQLPLLSLPPDQRHAVLDGLGHGLMVSLSNIARLNLRDWREVTQRHKKKKAQLHLTPFIIPIWMNVPFPSLITIYFFPHSHISPLSFLNPSFSPSDIHYSTMNRVINGFVPIHCTHHFLGHIFGDVLVQVKGELDGFVVFVFSCKHVKNCQSGNYL